MDEKTLFNGTFKTTNIPSIVLLLLGIIALFVGIGICGGDIFDFLKFCFTGYAEIIFLLIAVGFWIAALVIYMMMRNCQLVITDKKIYGRAAFGKKVSLPLDMLSSVSLSTFNCLSVATSSGRISFWMITNGDEAWDIINNLIVSRQK